MSTFHGKVAAVTGAGSGIGRALALGLARRGARLALSDVDEVGLGETARVGRTLGAEVEAARLDVADREAVKAYATAVASRSGWCTALQQRRDRVLAIGARLELRGLRARVRGQPRASSTARRSSCRT
ncbi:SDR family NAD(P)-dependent oxidoreductase [Nannocystis pusilla]|uniref:SDR family NAD(P)-dependent oxidoreductase n=1 Tax=Nannocystis pusilla TaxID=889268 RepID=A0A9X3F243_9BACT|nr:SDR family NAD(P)-dependent oxidoreductase [Nannocystis pusilla]MCY1013865.1 SDR family NAD(P)-dependent oxidoreductase [Nannocystis pusilla]